MKTDIFYSEKLENSGNNIYDDSQSFSERIFNRMRYTGYD